MTDCDTKERKAISQIWPDAYLLICLFHISSNWKNKLNQLLVHMDQKKQLNCVKKLKFLLEES